MATNNAVNQIKPYALFQGYYAATTAGMTGDGSVFELAFDSEVCDDDGSFSAGTFTAARTGIYALGINLTLGGLTALHTSCSFRIGTAAYYFDSCLINIGACITAAGECSIEHHVIMDLAVGDIVKAHATVSGSNKTVTINSGGAGEPRSWFYGYLINN